MNASIHPASNHSSQLSAAQEMGQEKKHEKLVNETKKWVGDAFYGTLLKQMRQSPFKSEIFDGGRGGEMFSTLFDQQLAGEDEQRRAEGIGQFHREENRRRKGVGGLHEAIADEPPGRGHGNESEELCCANSMSWIRS